MSAIRAMQEKTLSRKGVITLDCSKVTHVYPDGAIRLFAEIDRLKALSSHPRPIKIIPPKNTRSRQVFKQLDFLSLTDSDTQIKLNREDVIYWRCTAGHDQSGSVQGEFLSRVTDKANETSSTPIVLSDIWPGVSEAIINTTEHAYFQKSSRPDLDPIKNKWWLLTSLKDTNFSALVCDLGVGYRETVNRSIPEDVLNMLKNALLIGNSDTDALQLAMRYGRSRTGKNERGKGSRDALSILNSHGKGELMVISRKGLIKYKYDKETGELSPTITRLDVDINATIVWWSLPLAEAY